MATTGPTYGRYEILGELGWGGFAIVYRAWDPVLRREVALKAVLPHLARDPDLRQRFLSEAQTLAGLQHNNIVAVYDIGEAQGQPFFAMPFVSGGTLADLLASPSALPLQQVLDIIHSLASAIDYLHAAGIVHRDLKPQNVMLDPSGRVVLMDLGIARSLDGASMTRTGARLGTPEYMAPEQLRGEPAGPATDIYALGILTYHLLAGRPPFVGDAASILYAEAHQLPPPLQELRPGLPEAVYAAIDAALAKDPAGRPASAGGLADLLREPSPAQTFPVPQELPRATKRIDTRAPTEPPSTPRRLALTRPTKYRWYHWTPMVGLAALGFLALLIMLWDYQYDPGHRTHQIFYYRGYDIITDLLSITFLPLLFTLLSGESATRMRIILGSVSILCIAPLILHHLPYSVQTFDSHYSIHSYYGICLWILGIILLIVAVTAGTSEISIIACTILLITCSNYSFSSTSRLLEEFLVLSNWRFSLFEFLLVCSIFLCMFNLTGLLIDKPVLSVTTVVVVCSILIARLLLAYAWYGERVPSIFPSAFGLLAAATSVMLLLVTNRLRESVFRGHAAPRQGRASLRPVEDLSEHRRQ